MYSTELKTLALSLLLATFSTAAVGQTPSQPAPADKYVTNSGFKNRVFEVHNRMPDDLVPVIRLLTSGFKGAELAASNEFRTLKPAGQQSNNRDQIVRHAVVDLEHAILKTAVGDVLIGRRRLARRLADGGGREDR